MRTVFTVILFCLALSGFAELSSVAQESGAPRFESYPAVVWRGKPAALNQRSHALARMYRTLLGQQLREGVNFAGHYTLASVGCGTGCSVTAVIDARTGQAFFPNEFDGWTGIVGDYEIPEGEDSWTFRPGSRLLKAIGRPHIGKSGEERYGPSGIYFYEWKDNRLRQVKFTHVGSYPDADPPGGPGE
jgi:hypothetical protein